MQELAQEWFNYSDGKLFWSKSRAGRARKGKRFGTFDGRYRVGQFFGKRTSEHRLIHFYHYGKWPSLLDHVDRNTDNNLVKNLRESNTFLNAQNVDTTNHSSKQVGVGFHKASGRWRARSVINGKRVEIGRFKSEQEAINAYKNFNSHRMC